MNEPLLSEADLQAYVDCRLPAGRQAELEQYLAARPEELARVHAYRQQNEALRRRFQALADEPPTEHLAQLAAGPAPAAKRRHGPWPAWSLQRLAAGLAIALLGGLGGWMGHARYESATTLARGLPLSHQAAVAHAVYSPDVRRPVEVTADQEEQLVKWLSKRLGIPVRPPQLGALGYELVGGRLLPGNSGPVAQFMYQSAGGERMTLYVSTEYARNPETGFRFAREGEVNVFYWVDGKFGYALSGSIPKGELAKVATTVYEQLDH